MNWRRLGIGLIVVVLLGGAGFFGYTQFFAPDEETPGEEGDVDAISVDTGVDIVSAEGAVVPLAQAQLSFRQSGQVEALLVAEGDAVAQGDPLVRLDTTDQAIALQQAEAGLVQAQANLETAAAGLMAAENGLAAARIGVESAEAQLALVQAGSSDAQLALIEQQVAAAEAGVVQAAGSRDATLEAATGAELATAQAELTAAQVQYDAALKQYQPILQNEDSDDTQREQAQLQLSAAQSRLAAAQANLQDVQEGVTGGQRTAAEAGVTVAVNQRDAAEAELAAARVGAKPEQIAVAEAGVTQAEAAVAEAELQVTQAETAVTQAEAAVTEAEAAVAAAQTALDKRTLTAPFAGTVAALPVKVGQVVAAGQPVAIVADLSGWQIETTDLTELSVVNVARGFDVEVTIDAFPGETFRGTVTEISDVSAEVRGDVTYVVTIDLEDDLSLPLRWGMTAFVTADTDQ